MIEAVPQQQNATPEETARDLSHDLMSPYCPGRTIASCSSQAARDLEDEILQQAQAGKSREEIEQALVARFGEEIIGYAGRPVVLYGSAVAALVAAVLLVFVGWKWASSPRRRSRRTARIRQSARSLQGRARGTRGRSGRGRRVLTMRAQARMSPRWPAWLHRGRRRGTGGRLAPRLDPCRVGPLSARPLSR
jgi:cytochrome c-type biogenesis protein CcmH/NrfF